MDKELRLPRVMERRNGLPGLRDVDGDDDDETVSDLLHTTLIALEKCCLSNPLTE